MRCERHGLALGPDGHCVLCRRARASTAAGPSRARVALLLVLLVGIVGIVVLGAVPMRSRSGVAGVGTTAPTGSQSRAVPGATAVRDVLSTRNSSGRTGAFYLPTGYAQRPCPLLVAIHGTGGSGAAMVGLFADAAERRKFIVVAPDSRRRPDAVLTWEVGDKSGEVTPDFEHIRACLAEVTAMPGVSVDAGHVLIVGHSGGASTAPYVATNAEPYTAFAVLHGGVFPGGLGSRRVRGWFSTGTADPIRPPGGVQDAADSVRRLGFQDVLYREFGEGHQAGPQELQALLAWWLGG